MNTINLTQNSDEWHEFRRKGLGSSDANTIMLASDYMTPYQLWQEKLGIKKFDFSNFATELGHRFEGPARAYSNLEYGINLEPECVVHSEFDWLRASLDGLDLDKRVFAEIKYMGRENYEWCLENKICLEKHFPQVMHQFLVTGFSKCYYVPYTLTSDRSEIDKITAIEMVPDQDYILKKLFPALNEFWKLVVNQEEPPLTPKDEVIVEDDFYVALARKYATLKKQIKVTEFELVKVETELKKLTAKGGVIRCGDVKITEILRKGNVDYQNIPQLKGLNLDEFRKSPSLYSKIDLIGGKE